MVTSSELKQRLEAFCVFSEAHIASGDIDPAYPVLKDVYDRFDLPLSERVWRTVLYVAFYHLGSAERAWELYPTAPDSIEPFHLPTGVERRGFRGQPNRVSEHLNSVLTAGRRAGGLGQWAESQAEAGGEAGWVGARAAFQTLAHCGPWASYKWADLMKHTLGFNIEANDIGVGGRGKKAGPIPGMEWVTGFDWKRCATNVDEQKRLLDDCRAAGVPFAGLDQLETSLCDVNSLIKGRYYVGHDIDMMMKQLESAGPMFWEARQRVIAPGYLGEAGGWFGSRAELMRLYRDKGVIWDRGVVYGRQERVTPG
tara:strand:- start:2447 stop:3379 length:933 start_codon:yes stop_codon:yes gene_type:complete